MKKKKRELCYVHFFYLHVIHTRKKGQKNSIGIFETRNHELLEFQRQKKKVPIVCPLLIILGDVYGKQL